MVRIGQEISLYSSSSLPVKREFTIVQMQYKITERVSK